LNVVSGLFNLCSIYPEYFFLAWQKYFLIVCFGSSLSMLTSDTTNPAASHRPTTTTHSKEKLYLHATEHDNTTTNDDLIPSATFTLTDSTLPSAASTAATVIVGDTSDGFHCSSSTTATAAGGGDDVTHPMAEEHHDDELRVMMPVASPSLDRQARYRVKLYYLCPNTENWVDKGTGLCSVLFVEVCHHRSLEASIFTSCSAGQGRFLLGGAK
jgi:hypothetical protein